jgi:crotonobetainyl-CoA:carnitine CoA-transferase CaiB-like acyl-CoA transferase
VLDLSEAIAGPFAARLLGDFGASVIKVEKPHGGDAARYFEPLKADAPETERSLLFQYLNWNKRSVTLDLSQDSAKPILKKLIENSDIVIESFRPGQLAAWGLPFDKLFEWNPNAVITSVTNFGQNGPYADYEADDLIIYAMSGVMAISGREDLEPLKHGLQQAAFCAGLNAAYASLAARTVTSRFGGHEHVDLSIHECVSSELVANQPPYVFRGLVQGRPPRVKDVFAGDPLLTKEGFLTIQMGGGAPAEEFATLFGREEFRDPEMRSNRGDRMEEVRAMLSEILAQKPARQWFEEGTALRLLVGMVQGAKDLLDCPQLEERKFFWDMDHPATGKFRFPGEIVKLSKSPAQLRQRSPLLGEHTSEVLCDEIGLSSDELRQLRQAGVV